MPDLDLLDLIVLRVVGLVVQGLGLHILEAVGILGGEILHVARVEDALILALVLVLTLTGLLGRLAKVEGEKVLASVATDVHGAEVPLELLVGSC